MTDTNKQSVGIDLILMILAIIILFYSFYIGALLLGLIVVFQIVFIWVLIRIAVYIRGYIELNKRHIELSNRYYTQKMKQLETEKSFERR